MEKKDISLLILLIGLLFGYQLIDPIIKKKFFPDPPAPAAAPAADPAAVPVVPPAGTNTVTAAAAPADPAVVPAVPAVETVPVLAAPAQTVWLTNEVVSVEVASRGAAVIGAKLTRYRERNEEDSPPVEFNFQDRPSLAYLGLPVGSVDMEFDIEEVAPGRTISLTAATAQGLSLVRTLTLLDDYEVKVKDTFTNTGPNPLAFPAAQLQLGKMHKLPNVYSAGDTMGVDALLQQGEGVEHFGKKIRKWLKGSDSSTIHVNLDQRVDWIAAKNKFFCHLITVHESEMESPEDMKVYAKWNPEEKQVEEVAADLVFSGFVLEPERAYSREMTYFVGPKQYTALKAMNEEQERVMEFGFLTPVSTIILSMLNKFHAWIWPHNYGLSIILLTLFIKVLFWPLTHKGTESMKRMQELAPEMQVIRDKHKDDPQKQQQEIMAFYKKNKVNPLGGCLPMLVQFPVFISLFYVIRSAVELRFGSFLWISDLSEPERILEDVLPFTLNLLPLAMSATMFVQQKLTPSSADPAQQKIMMFFPIMLLFFLYNMPSGLLLYWTTSNLLMIGQLMVKPKKKHAEAAS